MKLSRLFPLGLLTLSGALMAADPDAASARINVVYVHPENFTDVNDSAPPGTDKGRAAILEELRVALVKDAARLVPEGQHLTITFSDIDLAGEFEPWRGPQWQDVRIVKDIYPPRLSFSFSLVGSDGKVIKQGERKLTDMTFQMRLTVDQSDHLRYEKDMLDDWLRSEFWVSKKH